MLLCALIGAMVSATAVSLAAEIPLTERKSGYEFMGPETRAMQDDDTANPASLWVLDGEALWKRKVGAASKSCADCHGDAGDSMKGVAARYPAFNADTRAAGQSRPADQYLPRPNASRRRRCRSKARSCSR